MKTLYFFIITAFSFLWAWDRASSFLKEPRWERSLLRLFIEGIELFVQVSLILLIYVFLAEPLIPAGRSPLYPFLFLAAAYVFSLLRHRTEIFMLIVFGLTLSCFPRPDLTPVTSKLLLAGKIIAVMFFFTASLLGIRKRLLFSTVPAPSQGLPVLLLSASIVALAFWAFQGILP